MTIELDHIILLTEVDAPHADLLVEAGLVEGASNSHPGQGTSNRRFFFENTVLEFLYVHDAVETVNGPAKGLRFQDRRSQAGASPFGFVMRAVQGDAEIPFEGWKYCPDYFDSDVCFHVGGNSDVLEEPLCICMPVNLSQRNELPIPENFHWRLTKLHSSISVLSATKPLQEIAKCQNIEVQLNKPHCLELTFNDGAEGKRKDFTSEIPLIFNW